MEREFKAEGTSVGIALSFFQFLLNLFCSGLAMIHNKLENYECLKARAQVLIQRGQRIPSVHAHISLLIAMHQILYYTIIRWHTHRHRLNRREPLSMYTSTQASSGRGSTSSAANGALKAEPTTTDSTDS